MADDIISNYERTVAEKVIPGIKASYQEAARRVCSIVLDGRLDTPGAIAELREMNKVLPELKRMAGVFGVNIESGLEFLAKNLGTVQVLQLEEPTAVAKDISKERSTEKVYGSHAKIDDILRDFDLSTKHRNEARKFLIEEIKSGGIDDKYVIKAGSGNHLIKSR